MKKIVSSMLAALFICAAFAGCGSSDDGEAVAVQSVAMLAGVQNTGIYNSYAGLVVSKGEVNFDKDESKTVSQVFVEVGDTVSVGDVLFEYDTEELQLNVEKGELELEQMKNSVTTYNNQIAALEKEKRNAPSSEQLSYTMQIQALEVDKKEMEYNITVKQKELDRMKSSESQADVTSTVDGTIKSINENGGYDDNGNPLHFISIVETGEYRIKGTINELNVYNLPEGTPVIVRSRIDPDVTWTGYVDSIDWENQVSSGNNMYYDGGSDEMTTSTKYPFYVALDNTENLMLGQHVYIEPDMGQQEETEGLDLPEYYIVDAESGAWVWAANDKDKLEKRSIELGEYNAEIGSYTVLSGLTADDYIAYPEDGLKEGRSVTYYDDAYFNGGDADNDAGMIDGAYDDGGMLDEGYIENGYVDEGYLPEAENDIAMYSEDGYTGDIALEEPVANSEGISNGSDSSMGVD